MPNNVSPDGGIKPAAIATTKGAYASEEPSSPDLSSKSKDDQDHQVHQLHDEHDEDTVYVKGHPVIRNGIGFYDFPLDVAADMHEQAWMYPST
jgi:hypothetical protein